MARANSSDSEAGSSSDGAAGSEPDARRTGKGQNAGAEPSAADDIDFDEDVERHARAERRLRALEERAGMAVQIEESYAAQLQRQDAAGDGLFVVAGFYGRASAVRWLAEELRGGKAVDTDAILGRFARSSNGSTGSGSSTAAMAPAAAGASAAARLAAEEWGCVIDVAGPLQAAVEVTARDSQSEIAVVQLFLPAGSKCGGTSHGAANSSGHHGSSSAAGSAAASVDGFWDPCDGEDKALWLRYEFLGRVHEVLIGDEEPLKCPLRKHVVRGAAPVFQRALRSLYAPFMASRSAIISSPASAAAGSSASKLGSGARSRFGGSGSGSGSAARHALPATVTRESKRAGTGGASGAGGSTPRAVTPSRAAGGEPAGHAASPLGPRSPLGSRSLGSIANTNTTAAASDAAARSRLSIGMFRAAADADTDGKATHAGDEKQSLGLPADKLSRAAAASIIDADGPAASVRAAGTAGGADKHDAAVTDENVAIFAAMARSPHVTTRSKTTAAVPYGSSSAGVDSSSLGDCVLSQYPCTPARKHGDGLSATTAATGNDGCGEAYTQLKPSVAVLTPPTAPGTGSDATIAGGKAAPVPAFDLEGILRAARAAGAAARPAVVASAAPTASSAGASTAAAAVPGSSAAAASLNTSGTAAAGDASASAQLDTSGEAAAPGDGGPALVTYTRSVDAATGEVVIMALASPKAATNTRRSHALVARAHARSGAASGAVPAGAASVRQGPRHAPRRHGQHHHASAAGAAGGADTNGVSGVGLSSSSASASSSADAALAAAEAAFAAAQAKIRQLQVQGGAVGTAAAPPVGTDGYSSASSSTAAAAAPPAISLVHVTLADDDDDARDGSSGGITSARSSSSPAASRRGSARRTASSANLSAAGASASADGKLGHTKDIVLESDAAAGARWSLPTRIAVAAAAVGALGFGALWLLKRHGMLSDSAACSRSSAFCWRSAA